MGALFALLFTVTMIAAQVSANGHEDGNSLLEIASFMKENFRELFQRLDRLESKVNRIVGKENCKPGEVGSGGEILDKDSPDAFNGTGTVARSRSNESRIEASREEVQRLHRIISELATVPACQRNAAHLPQPVIFTAVNSPQILSCESNGHPVKSCLWGHSVNGTGEAIIMDEKAVENSGRTTVDGVTFFGNSSDLEAGKCTLNIESVAENHAGLWSCTLVSKNSTIFSGAVHVAIASSNSTASENLKLVRSAVECEDRQNEFLQILKQVFDDAQNCAPCPDCDMIVKPMLNEAEAKLQRKQRTLEELTAAWSTPSSGMRSARVPNPVVDANVNTSAILSCTSDDGQPWSLCVWERHLPEERKLVIIDEEVVQNGGRTLVNGVAYVGDGKNNDGKCEINIEPVTEQDFGQWRCTLASQNGTFSTGQLSLKQKDFHIYFVTSHAGLSTFSVNTKQVKKIVNSNENLIGITYDSIRDKIYWSNGATQIYRANRDGTELVTVLGASAYGHFYGLAFDWIGGNIYVATAGGYILACSASTTPTISCFPVLQGQGYLSGVAVNPAEGMMYWTRYDPGSIHKAGMDGSSPSTIVTGLGVPRGLTIDLTARRLYWTDARTNKIQTTDLEGRGLQTVVQLSSGSYPWGIAVTDDHIYWGNHGHNTLQSSTKDGQDIQTLYTETEYEIRSIILMPAVNQPTTRKNHCEGISCSKLCVLSPTSYRCLP